MVPDGATGAPGGNRRRRVLKIAACAVVVVGIIAAVLGTQLQKAGSRRGTTRPVASPGIVTSGTSRDDPVYGLVASTTKPTAAGEGTGVVVTPVTQPAKDAASNANPITSMPTGRPSALTPFQVAKMAAGFVNAPDQQGANVCTPRNGRELEDMVSNSAACAIIILTNSRDEPYLITRVMNVTSPKIIIGNPLTLPVIRTSPPTVTAADMSGGGDIMRTLVSNWGPERIFDVQAGGMLDLRHLTVYTASGRLDPNTRTILVMGGAIRVSPGGTLTATGCAIGLATQTVEVFIFEMLLTALNLRLRVLGGFILVTGGTVTLTGCMILDVRQLGSPLPNQLVVGGSVCQLGGNMVLVGTYFINVLLFGNAGGVGGITGVLGGTLTWVGGGLIVVGGAINLWGAGKLAFVGGGVFVEFGASYATVIGLYARGGVAEKFVGGGVHYSLGLNAAIAFGCSCLYMVGNLFAIGGGTTTYVGGAVTFAVNQLAVAGPGGIFFVGSGHLDVIGHTTSQAAVCTSLSGIGFFIYNGAGSVNYLNSASASAVVAVAQLGIGTEIYMGAGWVNAIATRTVVAAVALYNALGSLVYISAGGGNFINRRFSRAVKTFADSEPFFIYTVGKVKVPIFLILTNIQVTDKTGVQILPPGFIPPPGFPFPFPPPLPPAAIAGAPASPANETAGPAGRMLSTVEAAPVAKAQAAATSDGALTIINDETRRYMVERPEDLLAFITSMGDSRPSGLKELPAARVYVEGDAPCVLCDVKPTPTAAHIYGNNTCQVVDDCEGKTPAERVSAAQSKVQGPMPSLTVTGVHLLWRTVTLYCDSSKGAAGSCSDRQAKQALRDGLKKHFGHDQTFSLQVDDANTPLEPRLGREHLEMPIDPPEPLEDMPQCADTGRFQVYISTNYEGKAQELNKTWSGLFSSSTGRSAVLQGELKTSLSSLCAVGAEEVSTISYSTETPAFRPNALEVGPSISVVTPGEPGLAKRVVVGETYDVYVGNFAKGATVRFHAVGANGRLLGCDSTFPDIAIPEQGSSLLSWTPSEECGFEVGRRYYLTAYLKELPIVSATSTAFKVHKERN